MTKVTDEDVCTAVVAYVQAGKRGKGLDGAMKCAIEAVLAGRASTEGNAGEVLRELLAIRDLKMSHAQASSHAAKFPTDENYVVIDKLSTEIARRESAAWSRARSFAEADKP